MSVKMTTKISDQFKGYTNVTPATKTDKNSNGPHLVTVRSGSVVGRQHIQLFDKNGDITYVMGTYQTGGGSGYKLLLFSVFECVTDEISQDMIVVFDYPQLHSQTPAFKKAEKTLKSMTKGFKNIKIMNQEKFEAWSSKWQKKNKSIPKNTKR